MATKKKGLGKGLEALLGSSARNNQAVSSSVETISDETLDNKVANISLQKSTSNSGETRADSANTANRVLQIPLEECQRGKYQPRRAMDQESLDELAVSIKQHGVLQPIVLREIVSSSSHSARYEIIAGERRWRASQLAGLDSVPAIINNLDDETASAMALIENLQRDDLNPIDEAMAFSRLQNEFSLTHQQIADLVGKSRAAISNAMRLLSLHKDVQIMVENGDIEMGHARCLLSLPEVQQRSAALEIANSGLSVRQAEKLVKSWPPTSKARANEESNDPNIRHLENELSELLGMPVTLKQKSPKAGELNIKYSSLEELEGVLERIKG